MKALASRTLWGSLLILGGILFLLDNLGYIKIGGLVWAIILAVGGLVFVSVFLGDRQHWWALIPGIILLAVAATVAVDYLFAGRAGDLSGMIVLGGISLAFWMVYFVNREHWWAIIPAGVLATLAVVTGLDNILTGGIDTGGIFFLGLGATFALVAVLPTPHGQMKWAFIPAVVLIIIGLFVIGAATDLLNYIWPVALILAGAVILFRGFIWRR